MMFCSMEINVAKPARAINTQATAVTNDDLATGIGGGVSISSGIAA